MEACVHRLWIYSRGDGVAQNIGEAMRWYKLAADQGFAYAQYHLGVMYANGEGDAQDLVRLIAKTKKEIVVINSFKQFAHFRKCS